MFRFRFVSGETGREFDDDFSGRFQRGVARTSRAPAELFYRGAEIRGDRDYRHTHIVAGLSISLSVVSAARASCYGPGHASVFFRYFFPVLRNIKK